MATKKATTKKTAAKKKKKTGKSMVSWSEELAKRAQMAAAIEENVGSGGSFISLRGGRMSYDGAEVPDNAMNVVILDHILEYTYYEHGYDPDNPAPPSAYALGRDENTLRWHENSIEEYAGELCKDSDINQWGSAEKGKGKAAKNQRRLALITEGDLENLEDAKIVYLRIPVTSVKAWAGYVRQLEKTLQRPPFGVVTEISVVPDAKTQFKLQFKLVEAIDDGELMGELMEKVTIAEAEIDFPYAPPSEDEEAPAPRRRTPARKGGTARRTAPAKKAPAKKAGRKKY